MIAKVKPFTAKGAKKGCKVRNESSRGKNGGSSWETWVKKYVEKKAAGEKHIGLEPEALE